MGRPRTLPRNPCPICGGPKNRPDIKYCSVECAGKARRGTRVGGPKIKHLPKPCAFCGIVFKPEHARRKYCSPTCSGKGRLEESRAKGWVPLRKFSASHRQKMSENAKKRTGKTNGMYGRKAAHGKGRWHTTWRGDKAWLRSTWELEYAKYLDRNKTNYQVENRAFGIDYVYQGVKKQGTYRPDFYLEDLDIYIEVKGWWRDDAEAKFQAFKQQHPEIVIQVLNKNKLIDLGLNL